MLISLGLIVSLLFNIELMLPLRANAAPAVTVTWFDNRQTIDGFGASGAFQRATYLMNFPEPGRTQILDALFSQTSGAGLSLVRNIVGDGSTLSDGVPTIEPTEGTWVWTGDEGQVWLMNAAKARGTTRFFSTVWSPPAWMKTTGSIIGGSLRTDKYQAYATYLSQYVRGYKSNHNLDLYAVSLANEPCISVSYSSACWTGAQFRDFIRDYLKPTFQTDAVTAKVIIPEKECWDETLDNETLADSVAKTRLDIVGGHHYCSAISPFTNAEANGKRVWETEVSYFSPSDSSITDGIRWAKEVHDYMVTARANAFNYWWVVTEKTNGEALVNLNLSNNTYTLNKRLFTLGNYARFVRPDYVRIGSTTNPATNIFTSAYRDPATNQFVVVAINDNATSQAIDITPSGFSASTVTPYVTDGTRNLVQLANVSAVGGIFPVTLAARSVTTFVGTGTPGATPTPSPTSAPISAFNQIEAESYTSQSGVQVETTTDTGGGQNVGYIENGDWISFNNVNFGSGAASVDFRIASATSGGNIETRLDSLTGTLVSTCAIPGTGGWQTWQTKNCSVTGASGVHNLYLKFTGGTGYLFNVNWFKFLATGNPTATPTRTNTPSGPTATPTRTNTPSPSNFLLNGDMEGGTSNWAVFGSGTLTSDTTLFHGGTRSLKITGRTAEWNGISQNVAVSNFTNGQSYTVSVWVRSQTGTPTAKATLRLTAGTTTYVTLASAAINSTGWTLVSGTGPVSWSGTLTGMLFYVETAAGTDNIYLDDASLH